MSNQNCINPSAEIYHNCNKQSEQGVFWIVKNKQALQVMFVNDYVKKENITRYALKKQIASGEVKRLFIKSRKRLNSVIVVAGATKEELDSFENDFISDDSEGKFTILHEGRIKKVMFVNDYAQLHNCAKQLVFHHLDSASSKRTDIEKVTIERFGSDQSVVLVEIKNQ